MVLKVGGCLPLLSIIVVLRWIGGEEARNETGEKTAKDGDAKGDEERCKLHQCTSLGSEVDFVREVLHDAHDSNADNAADDAGDAVKIENTAGVIDVDLLLEEGRELVEA